MSSATCTVCSRTLARNADLPRHMLTHTGIKPHVCETCGKAFAQFSGLKTHRNIHTKAKPFICGINTCKKAFADPSSCTRHRKETHMLGGGPFKCFVAGCRTSIKRRSTFLTHLRKHGVDINSEEVRKVVKRTSQRRDAMPIHSASFGVENRIPYHSHGVSSFLGDNSRYDTIGNHGESLYFMNGSGLPDDSPFDCRRAHWFTAGDVELPNSNLGQITQVGPSHPAYDIYPCAYNDFQDQSCFDDIFFSGADHSLAIASPFSLPVLESFLEAGSDGFQSLLSSPASTYSTLYPNDFHDDMGPLSLPVPRESHLYSVM